jgi:hypothetical protein
MSNTEHRSEDFVRESLAKGFESERLIVHSKQKQKRPVAISQTGRFKLN